MKKQPTPAQAIKKELTELFPWVKFSCRYETFSMGDAVDIEWVDWPITKDVDAVVSKYQYWHFDGMIDMYENTNVRHDIPQAKFIHTKRRLENDTRDLLIKSYQSFNYDANVRNDWDTKNLIWKIYNNTALPIGAVIIWMKHIDGVSSWLAEDFRTLDYTVDTKKETMGNIELNGVTIVDYSEKAIAVTWDTRAIKEELKWLGGRWNFKLSCGAGRIFPKTKREQVEALLK